MVLESKHCIVTGSRAMAVGCDVSDSGAVTRAVGPLLESFASLEPTRRLKLD